MQSLDKAIDETECWLRDGSQQGYPAASSGVGMPRIEGCSRNKVSDSAFAVSTWLKVIVGDQEQCVQGLPVGTVNYFPGPPLCRRRRSGPQPTTASRTRSMMRADRHTLHPKLLLITSISKYEPDAFLTVGVINSSVEGHRRGSQNRTSVNACRLGLYARLFFKTVLGDRKRRARPCSRVHTPPVAANYTPCLFQEI
jgi:hypothetical protein